MKDERLRALEILDAQEGTGPVPILTGDEPARLLANSHRIALIGASPNAARPSNGVMQFLLEQGFEVVPIRPARTEILGQQVYATLEDATEATGTFDLWMSFAEPSSRPTSRGQSSRPGGLALAPARHRQLGSGAHRHDAGIPVVMDRCTRVEFRRIRLVSTRRRS